MLVEAWVQRFQSEFPRSIATPTIGARGVDLGKGIEYQLGSGGKRLRPALALWFHDRLGGDVESCLPWANAVEILHNVLLIHDDIEDGDEFRRGRPTLWKQFGVAVALNVADYLTAEMYRQVLATPAPDVDRVRLVELLTSVLRTTVEGQALDLGHRADPGFDLADYEAIIQRKTGRYLACGWVGAAILRGADARLLDALWEIGGQLGPAFQITDDLLDLTAGKGRGGEVGCDILEGKPSILFAHALQCGMLSTQEENRLVAILAKAREETSGDDVDWVIQLYGRCGALEYAQAEAQRRVDSGVRRFGELSAFDANAREEFAEIARFVVDRRT